MFFCFLYWLIAINAENLCGRADISFLINLFFIPVVIIIFPFILNFVFIASCPFTPQTFPLSKKLKTDFIPTSADSNKNINQLKERIYNELKFIRVYLRPKGGETDFKEPLIIRKGNTVGDVCNKLHRNMKKDFRFGLVWGKSVKFGGQRVGLNHILIDEDVLTVIKKR